MLELLQCAWRMRLTPLVADCEKVTICQERCRHIHTDIKWVHCLLTSYTLHNRFTGTRSCLTHRSAPTPYLLPQYCGVFTLSPSSVSPSPLRCCMVTWAWLVCSPSLKWPTPAACLHYRYHHTPHPQLAAQIVCFARSIPYTHSFSSD